MAMEIAKKEKKLSTVLNKLDALVQADIETDLDETGEFASSHEGISVLLAEIEEAEGVIKSIKKLYGEAWEGVKNEDYGVQLPVIAKLYLKGLYLAKEAVTVTARAEKYYKHLQKNNPQTGLMAGQMDITSAVPANVTDKVVKLVEDEESDKE